MDKTLKIGAIILGVTVLTVVVSVVTVGLVGSNQPGEESEGLLGSFGTRLPNGLAIGSGASVDTTGAFSVGNDGTQLAEIIHGTCNPKFNGTFSATTTKIAVCKSVTGVTSGDHVFVSLPGRKQSALGGSKEGFLIDSTRATTTDAFEFTVYNATGAATSTSDAWEGTHYWIVR